MCCKGTVAEGTNLAAFPPNNQARMEYCFPDYLVS